MSSSELLQPSPAFDMNSMIHAMPVRYINTKEQICYFHFVPFEILAEIFQWLLPHPWTVTQSTQNHYTPCMTGPMQVSHVCRRWRQVVVGFPSHWINLEMNCARHPGVLADLISRSRQLPFALSIRLPHFDIENASQEVRAQFKASITILKKNAGRLHSLHIWANNATFHLMFSTYLRHFNFSRLEWLCLNQVTPTFRRYNVGPVVFNPTIFRALHLYNIMIDCDASCLAGLRILHLTNASGTILDLNKMSHSTYPLVPTTPVMTQLAELMINGTNLLPTTDTFLPSFDHSVLRSLILARIRAPNPGALELVSRLFHTTYNPLLEHLVLDDFDDRALSFFLLGLTSPVPSYACVRRLCLAHLNLTLIDHRFMAAFPNVVELNLFTSAEPTRNHNPTRIMLLLTNPTLMPLLDGVNINDVFHQRRIAPRVTLPQKVASSFAN